MQETLGFSYFAEIPLVLFDIQRVGPSTGMPTRTQQGDLLACAFASHGDTRHVLLFPADPRECFELAITAFDLADRLQTPVIVLSDLDIGMNEWMCEKLVWDEGYRPDRGKVLDAAALAELDAFHRYLDRDGDGVCYRTYPGVDPKGAYFTRGSGHNARGLYTEDADEYRELVERLERKLETARGMVPPPLVCNATEKTPYGIISSGSCDAAVREAIERLAEKGFALDYLRVRAFPFSREVEEFISHHKLLFVVEQNRDAQLRTLLLADMNVPAEKLVSILHFDGIPIDSRRVFESIHRRIERSAAA
jgi:2-oxoglutarate ferredoxin oxidoreductase subunit alpha